MYHHHHPLAYTFFANGYLAVPLFFLLSGFILAYTYSSQIETHRDRVRFWQARFARLWPTYTFSLLCSCIASFTIPTAGLTLATLFMVQTWNPFHPGEAGAWNAIYWTLSVEAFFYFVFPWAQSWIERRTPRRLFLLAIVLIAFSVFANTGARTLGDPVYPGLLRFIPLPLIHLPEFLIGVTLGNLFLEVHATQASRIASLPIFTVTGAAATLITLCLPTSHFTSLVLIGFALLLYGLASERSLLSRLLSTRPLLLGGAISYSMYLLQTCVRFWVKTALASTHHVDGFVNMLTVVLLLILFATATYFFIEEPSRNLLRRFFSRFSGARTSAA